MTEDENQPLDRAQRRLLRRVYNGRTVPIVVDGTPFLTYKEAAKYLESLPPEQREAAYAVMKTFAGNRKGEAATD
ncbi:hypothetical protein WBP07_03015 [Novosphingobium sp. BL-8A]|uniref:hypothetical protein n=1 Tax=Novosphingobium sp. BL-8A TaxID=3127639 RepID=UPI00375733AE